MYDSTKLYRNEIRFLYVCVGLPNLLIDHIILRVLKGLNQIKKDVPNCMPIMTVTILKQIWNTLNFNSSIDATFGAVCLLSFFSMLRLSSLFPPVLNRLLIPTTIVYSWGVLVH